MTAATTSTSEAGLRISILGGVAGAGMAAIPAVVGSTADLVLLQVGGTLGIPIAAVLGWRFAAAVRRSKAAAAFGMALRMAVIAVAIGDLLVSGGMAVSAIGAGGLSGLVWAIAIPIIGLAIFGLPAFALAFTVLWAWTWVVRLLPTWIADPERQVGSG